MELVRLYYPMQRQATPVLMCLVIQGVLMDLSRQRVQMGLGQLFLILVFWDVRGRLSQTLKTHVRKHFLPQLREAQLRGPVLPDVQEAPKIVV